MKTTPLAFILSLFLTTGLFASSKPNFIFIITDDMYPWQMNFMPEGEGKNYTPHLDRLASEGTVMRNQYVSSTVCTPSRYSCMTGRYASRSKDPAFVRESKKLGQTHVQWNTFADPTREKTIAHHLSDAGYRTGFVGKEIMWQAALGLPEIELDEIWRCTTCGRCPSHCPRGVDQIEVGVAIRRIAAAYDVFPSSVSAFRTASASLTGDGNPLGEERGTRDAWAAGLSLKP